MSSVLLGFWGGGFPLSVSLYRKVQALAFRLQGGGATGIAGVVSGGKEPGSDGDGGVGRKAMIGCLIIRNYQREMWFKYLIAEIIPHSCNMNHEDQTDLQVISVSCHAMVNSIDLSMVPVSELYNTILDIFRKPCQHPIDRRQGSDYA